MDPLLAALLGLALVVAPSLGHSVSFVIPGLSATDGCPRLLLSGSVIPACAAIDAVCQLLMAQRCFGS